VLGSSRTIGAAVLSQIPWHLTKSNGNQQAKSRLGKYSRPFETRFPIFPSPFVFMDLLKSYVPWWLISLTFAGSHFLFFFLNQIWVSLCVSSVFFLKKSNRERSLRILCWEHVIIKTKWFKIDQIVTVGKGYKNFFWQMVFFFWTVYHLCCLLGCILNPCLLSFLVSEWDGRFSFGMDFNPFLLSHSSSVDWRRLSRTESGIQWFMSSILPTGINWDCDSPDFVWDSKSETSSGSVGRM